MLELVNSTVRSEQSPNLLRKLFPIISPARFAAYEFAGADKHRRKLEKIICRTKG